MAEEKVNKTKAPDCFKCSGGSVSLAVGDRASRYERRSMWSAGVMGRHGYAVPIVVVEQIGVNVRITVNPVITETSSNTALAGMRCCLQWPSIP
jgi:hypothetical protein